MSARFLGSCRPGPVSHFTYFLHNTSRSLSIDSPFLLNNRFLVQSPQRRAKVTPPKSSASDEVDHSIRSDHGILASAASRVLKCQDPDEARISANSQIDHSAKHIPFPITPKRKCVPTEPGVVSIRAQILPYIKLTKPNLTVLVTLSCICSYAISPLTVSLPELMALTVGTALCSGAANAINMGREPEFDRKMPRTVGRPVVRGLVTPRQAYTFAAGTGFAGTALLYAGVNPLVAALGATNIVLYAWIYTSLKRKHIINTWVGAVVGAIPPLMGWAASSSLHSPAAWCLAGLLYAWQFPHFNALSHNVAQQYKSAGYVMTAAENPRLNARVALRYSLLMFPLCFGLCYFGVTDWFFAADSAVANGWLTYYAYKFWAQQRLNYAHGSIPSPGSGLDLASVYAKKLFWCSVWQLPAVLILAMLHKKGQWDRLFTYFGLKRSGEQVMA